MCWRSQAGLFAELVAPKSHPHFNPILELVAPHGNPSKQQSGVQGGILTSPRLLLTKIVITIQGSAFRTFHLLPAIIDHHPTTAQQCKNLAPGFHPIIHQLDRNVETKAFRVSIFIQTSMSRGTPLNPRPSPGIRFLYHKR